MSPLRVTIDTNLLVSGAVRVREESPPVRLLDAWHAKQFGLVVSAPLVAEVARTLANRYFSPRMTPQERMNFLQLLQKRALITELTHEVQGVATHPEDDMVLSTALSGEASYLVTGDHKLLELKTYEGLIIVDVRAFLSMLPGLVIQDKDI